MWLTNETERPQTMPQPTDVIQAEEKLGESRDVIVKELRKTIMGMEDVIDGMMIAIFALGQKFRSWKPMADR